MGITLWSVGHSTHSLAGFLDVLAPHGIEIVADIRRYPGSRRHPHFAEPALRSELPGYGLQYEWLPELGGRRTGKGSGPPAAASGWRHPAFRAYAAHLKSDEFAAGVEALVTLARRGRTAMMCSEVLWWRCHRRLIADVLVARGARVVHIFSAEKSEPHVLRPPARLIDGRLEYPAEPPEPPEPLDGSAGSDQRE